MERVEANIHTCFIAPVIPARTLSRRLPRRPEELLQSRGSRSFSAQGALGPQGGQSPPGPPGATYLLEKLLDPLEKLFESSRELPRRGSSWDKRRYETRQVPYNLSHVVNQLPESGFR